LIRRIFALEVEIPGQNNRQTLAEFAGTLLHNARTLATSFLPDMVEMGIHHQECSSRLLVLQTSPGRHPGYGRIPIFAARYIGCLGEPKRILFKNGKPLFANKNGAMLTLLFPIVATDTEVRIATQ